MSIILEQKNIASGICSIKTYRETKMVKNRSKNKVGNILRIFFFAGLLFAVGCESTPAVKDNLSQYHQFCDAAIYTDYTPAKAEIMPLTECKNSDDDDQKVNVFVSLLDSFGSPLKTPAIFRFELYQYVPRSAEPKGKRIFKWPDIDLTGPDFNNKHWRDFLRAYEFNLDFEFSGKQNYIIYVTCQCPNGKRLVAQRNI